MRSRSGGARSRLKGPALLVAMIVAIIALWQANNPSEHEEGGPESVSGEEFKPTLFGKPVLLRKGWLPVLRIVDGDTIIVLRKEKQERIRLIGVNAPELHVSDERPPAPGAVEAAHWLETLLRTDPQVELEYDEEREDKFDRTLAYAWVEREGKRLMVNEELIRAGHGIPKFYPPNTKHKTRLERAKSSFDNNEFSDTTSRIRATIPP